MTRIFVSALIIALGCRASANVSLSGVQQNSMAVTFQQESFAGKPQIVEQRSDYTTVMPDIRFYESWGLEEEHQHHLAGHLMGILPVNSEEKPAVAAPELYFQKIALQNKVHWTLGRIKQNWSELDSYWGAGVWQPLVRWDASRPVEQGLTGFFLDTKINDFRGLFFVSGLFIPDQGPLYNEKDGDLTSTNRWFREPTPAAGFRRGFHKINYDINSPDSSDIVFNNSFAAEMSFGSAAWDPQVVGGFFKFAFADKPANQFHLEIDPLYNMQTLEINAQVFPSIIRHKVYTFETGYQWAQTRLTLSTTTEEYDNPEVNLNYEQSPIIDARYDGLILSQSLDPVGVRRASIDFSYINRNEKSDSSESTIIKGDVEASTQRFNFKQMVGLRLNKNIIARSKRRLDIRAAYNYSINDKGEWIQLSADYLIEKRWNINFSGDVFGVPAASSSSTSFISRYRGNDRVMGSVSYVF